MGNERLMQPFYAGFLIGKHIVNACRKIEPLLRVCLGKTNALYKRMHVQLAECAQVERIGGIGNVAYGNGAIFCELRISGVAGFQLLLCCKIVSVEGDSLQEGYQACKLWHPTLHVRQFQMAMRIYKTGHQHTLEPHNILTRKGGGMDGQYHSMIGYLQYGTFRQPAAPIVYAFGSNKWH
jgi:hypothetical protein